MENLVCVKDFEVEASKILKKSTREYYKLGAGNEFTLQENRNAYKKWIIRPRMLRDVSSRDLSTVVLGKSVSFPVGMSPTAFQKFAHPDGEIASCAAAGLMGTIHILSFASTTPMEEVAKANPNTRKWFQLFLFKDRSRTLDLIRRAENCGFEALVLTVDAAYVGKRHVRRAFELPSHIRMGHLEDGACDATPSAPGKSSPELIKNFHEVLVSRSVTWKDVLWLKSNTRLPIVMKGILSGEDANLAVLHGASGILVSNHGGRALECNVPTIDALPDVMASVKGRCNIFLDGGVSTGTDIFKALALGAKMVFVGRPVLWGLAVGGEQGAKRVLEILREEFDLTMALAGVTNVEEINRNYVARASRL